MHEAGLRLGVITAFTRASRSVQKNHESGPAPKSQSRGDLLCPVLSSPVRSVSTCSSLPLLVLSSGQSVVSELSQAFQCNSRHLGKSSLPNSCIFSLLTPHAGVLPFGGFSMLLEEITRGSFCGLIAIRLPRLGVGPGNPGFKGLPRYGLEIHHWVSKVSLQSSWIRSKNTIRHSSSVLWLWTSGVKVYHCAHSSSLHQKTEVGRFTQDQHRFGSLQRLWRSPNVLVKQFEAAHSRASYEPRILHVRSPSSQISVNSGLVSFKAGQGLRQKGNFLQYTGPLPHSCSCGKQHQKLLGFGQERKYSTGVSPLFAVDFWTKVLVTASKTLRDGVIFPEESVQDSRGEE